MPWVLAVLAGIALGALVGCWQGFWVAYVGVPAFIVTLGGMLIFRGLAIVLVGVTVADLPAGFVNISNGSLPNSLNYLADRDVVTLLIGALVIGALIFGQVRARLSLIKHDLRRESVGAMIAKLVVFSVLIGALSWILAGSRGGFPAVLVIVGVLIVAYSFVMGRTVFGRHELRAGRDRGVLHRRDGRHRRRRSRVRRHRRCAHHGCAQHGPVDHGSRPGLAAGDQGPRAPAGRRVRPGQQAPRDALTH